MGWFASLTKLIPYRQSPRLWWPFRSTTAYTSSSRRSHRNSANSPPSPADWLSLSTIPIAPSLQAKLRIADLNDRLHPLGNRPKKLPLVPELRPTCQQTLRHAKQKRPQPLVLQLRIILPEPTLPRLRLLRLHILDYGRIPLLHLLVHLPHPILHNSISLPDQPIPLLGNRLIPRL